MDHLITAAAEKVHSLKGRIDQLNLLHYPSKNPTLLINLFSRLANLLSIKLEDYREQAQQANSKGDGDRIRQIKREVNLAVILVKKVASHLRYIEGASVERTPWNFIVPLEKLAQQLLINTKMIVRPQWHYNYGVLEIIEQYSKEVEFLLSEEEQKEMFGGFPDHFYILSFPGLERSNVLLHVNFGHEIGHPFAEEYLHQENPKYLLSIQSEVNEYISKTTTADLPLFTSDKADELAKIAKQVANIRRRALEEIICDLVSVKLFGPAAIFALHEVAVFSESFDTVSRRTLYPPWRTRLRLALEEVKWNDWQACLSGISTDFPWGKSVELSIGEQIKLLQEIVKVDSDQRHIKEDVYTNIAYESAYKALPNIKEYLNNRLSSHAFNISRDVCLDIFKCVERLVNHIPPNEIIGNDGKKITSLGLRVILNAGWFYRLTYLTSMFERGGSERFFGELDILNRLILKATEMIDLQREYEKYKNARRLMSE
jgi:hypothetical protein